MKRFVLLAAATLFTAGASAQVVVAPPAVRVVPAAPVLVAPAPTAVVVQQPARHWRHHRRPHRRGYRTGYYAEGGMLVAPTPRPVVVVPHRVRHAKVRHRTVVKRSVVRRTVVHRPVRRVVRTAQVVRPVVVYQAQPWPYGRAYRRHHHYPQRYAAVRGRPHHWRHRHPAWRRH